MNLLNRVKVATATTGNAATPIALGGADAGFQTFANGGAINEVEYTYIIEDGVNWEVQSQVYNSTGPTINRGTPIASSNGGARITLSGAAKISVQPNVRNIMPQIGAVRATSYFMPFGFGDNNNGSTHVVNRLISIPFPNYFGKTVTSLLIKTGNTVVASSNCKLAIYSAPNNKGQAFGSPLVSTGNLSTAVADTLISATGLNAYIPPGLLFFHIWTSAAVNFKRCASNSRFEALNETGAYQNGGYFGDYANIIPRKILAFGAWPTNLTGQESDWDDFSVDTDSIPAVTIGYTT